MKKISIFVLSILIVMGISKVSFAFDDIEKHWAEDIIVQMHDKKIINGYNDVTFKPDNSMTRAEFITVINKLLGLKQESSKYIPDITRQDWYYEQIRIAVYAGIIQGNESRIR